MTFAVTMDSKDRLGLRVAAKGLAGVALVATVAACAIPPAVSIASFALDGVSYAATGKSVQDHAISAVADEDCALWRVAKGAPVCAPGGPIDAVAAEGSGTTTGDSGGDSGTASVQLAQFSPPPLGPWNKVPVEPDRNAALADAPSPPVAISPAAKIVSAPLAPMPGKAAAADPVGKPVSSALGSGAAAKLSGGALGAPSVAAGPGLEPGLYVVYGSFEDPERATAAAEAQGAAVVAATANGRTVHRVVDGPYARARATALKRAVPGAWLTTI